MTEPTGVVRVVITRRLPGDPESRLREALGDRLAAVVCNPRDVALERPALLAAARGATALVTTPGDRVDAELLEAAGPGLRIVSNFAVGVDNIDLPEAARRGVRVGHTPGAVTEPTADIAWLLLLGAARRATEGIRLVRSGRWSGLGGLDLLGARIVGRTLLVVGAGRIGLAVARRSVGWQMRVLYVARSDHPEIEAPPIDGRRVDLETGLREADFVSLHTPLTEETRHLIGAPQLALMRPGAVLVNTARGAVIDEQALVEALRAGRIAAAGLDVYEREPRLAPGLTELDNAFLLPHLGSATVEDRQWMMEIAIDNAAAVLRGEEPLHAVV
jgi:glyoxylate reductase